MEVQEITSISPVKVTRVSQVLDSLDIKGEGEKLEVFVDMLREMPDVHMSAPIAGSDMALEVAKRLFDDAL